MLVIFWFFISYRIISINPNRGSKVSQYMLYNSLFCFIVRITTLNLQIYQHVDNISEMDLGKRNTHQRDAVIVPRLGFIGSAIIRSSFADVHFLVFCQDAGIFLFTGVFHYRRPEKLRNGVPDTTSPNDNILRSIV